MKDKYLREEVSRLRDTLCLMGILSWDLQSGRLVGSMVSNTLGLERRIHKLETDQQLILGHLDLEFKDQPSRRVLKQKETKTEEDK